MKKTFDIYLHPHILKALQKKKKLNIIRICTDNVEPNKKNSRFGYEGDTWYILESGRYYDDNCNIVVYSDNTAKKKSGNIGIDIITPCLYEDATGEKIPASKIPKWAARTWVEVQGVSYPKRIQELTESDILTCGFEKLESNGDMSVFGIGDHTYSTNMGLKTIFSQWWDEFMGSWRLINKQGRPHEYISYPYADDNNLREIAFDSYPRRVVANTHVVIYSVKII